MSGLALRSSSRTWSVASRTWFRTSQRSTTTLVVDGKIFLHSFAAISSKYMNTVETFAILGMLSKNAFFLAASCHGKNPIKVWFSSSTHRQYAAFFPAFIFFPALSVAVSLKVRVYNPRLLGCGTFRDLLSLYSTCSLYHAKTSFLLTENLLASSVKSD